MTLIPIPGMTAQSIADTSTEPTSTGGRPFPCDANGWTKHTATVRKAYIKHFDNSGKDYIGLRVENGQCSDELLIALDARDIPTGLTPEKAQAAMEKNLATLQMAVKLLGAHTNGQLDTVKLEKASGQIVEIIAKHKGFRQYDGKHYHKITLILTGAAPALLPIDPSVQLPPLPGAALPAAPAPMRDPLGDDDIPF
jgi:hypothetical protein